MDKKSKILISVFFILILISAAVTYYRTIIKKDYIISAQADCDPSVDKCFIWKCDPTATDETLKCTGDPEKDTWYYQIAKRKAANIPLCDPKKDENCDPWTCADGEKDCSATFCDAQTSKEQKVECSDPVQYNIDNPPAEDTGDNVQCDAKSGSCPVDESGNAPAGDGGSAPQE